MLSVRKRETEFNPHTIIIPPGRCPSASPGGILFFSLPSSLVCKYVLIIIGIDKEKVINLHKNRGNSSVWGIWECELKPIKREDTLESLTYTLNKIFLQDRTVKRYEIPEEEPMIAAEDVPTTYKNKVT